MARALRTKPAWLEEIFSYEQKSVEVNGRTMAYVEAGPQDGRPVLLLSGNPTWGFLYREFFGPLAEAGYRAIAPDWVGAGYSDHPRLDSALTFAHHIADLVSFIDQLGLNGYVVVGQDWGGPQGLGAAIERIRPLGRAGPDEHVGVHGWRRAIPLFAATMDDLACAAHRAVLHEASEGAFATGAFGDQPEGNDGGRGTCLSPRVRRT